MAICYGFAWIWRSWTFAMTSTGPQIIHDRKWSPNWTANDPQTGPQMIPNRKWSPMWTAKDPAGKCNWHGVCFPDFFIFIFVFIYFHQLNDELDEHKEKYSDNVNYNLNIILITNLSYFLLTILQKKYREKNQSSYTAIPFLNKFDLQQ